MKAAWLTRLSAVEKRIDAWSVRERAFLLLAMLASVAGAVDALWLTPKLTAYQTLVKKVGTQRAELKRLQADVMAVGQADIALASTAGQLLQMQNRREELEQYIRAATVSRHSGQALEDVLVQLLRRYEGLTLIGLHTTGGGAAAPTDALLQSAGLQKRGLEIKVLGSYAELTRYMQALEGALPHLRWGPVQLKRMETGNVLTLQLFILEGKS